MKVIRENSKANFDDLKVGDKYFGHKSGKLCTKTSNTHGVRLEDGAIGFVPVGQVVGVPVAHGKTVRFSDLKPGQTFIRKGVSDAEAFVCVKNDYCTATRLGNGQRLGVSASHQVEALTGTYTFKGKN